MFDFESIGFCEDIESPVSVKIIGEGYPAESHAGIQLRRPASSVIHTTRARRLRDARLSCLLMATRNARSQLLWPISEGNAIRKPLRRVRKHG